MHWSVHNYCLLVSKNKSLSADCRSLQRLSLIRLESNARITVPRGLGQMYVDHTAEQLCFCWFWLTEHRKV